MFSYCPTHPIHLNDLTTNTLQLETHRNGAHNRPPEQPFSDSVRPPQKCPRSGTVKPLPVILHGPNNFVDYFIRKST